MAAHDNGPPAPAPSRERAEKQQLPGITKSRLTGLDFNGVVGHNDHLQTEFARKLLGLFESETGGSDCGWWETRTADVLIEIARAGPLVVALAG